MIHSMAVLITAVTGGPIATAKRSTGIAVDTVWEVALHLWGLKDQAVCAEEVLTSAGIAVPVLCTVEQVRIVAWLPILANICGMMVVWSTVRVTIVSTVVSFAVLVTFVAHQPITTVDSIVPVAHHPLFIVLEIFHSSILFLARAQNMLTHAPSTVPVLPAVILVGVIAVSQFRAIKSGLVRAVQDCCFKVAILVTHSTNWPITTISVLLEVASHEDEIENLWLSSRRVVRAENVLVGATSVTVPIFSAVEGIGEVAISSSVAVKEMTAVLCCCCCCASRLSGTHFRVFAWSQSTVYVLCQPTPFYIDIKDPRKAICMWFALHVTDTAS